MMKIILQIFLKWNTDKFYLLSIAEFVYQLSVRFEPLEGLFKTFHDRWHDIRILL